MPITNKNIAIEESATVTARVATVQIARGSTNEQQELLTIGDPSDSLGMARVVAATPVSSEYGLVVRVADPSTGAFAISSIAGVTRIAPNDTNFASSAGFHFDSSGALNIKDQTPPSTGPIVISSITGLTRTAPNDTNWASSAGFHFDSSGAITVKEQAPSTGPIAVSSIAGQTRVAPTDTNWASSAGFHFDSSGALNIKDQTAPSTGPIVISSITGQTRVAPTDTNWASSAGFHFNSSGELNVNAAFSGSTDVKLSAVAQSTQAQNSSNYLPVRLTDGSAFTNYSTITAVSSVAGIVAVRPSDTNWASSAGFHFDSSGALQTVASFTGSTDVRISAVAISTTAQNSSGYLPVRLTDGSSFLNPIDVVDGSTNSTLVGGLLAFNNSSGNTMRMAGSSSPLPVHLRDSTGAVITLGTDYSDGSTTSTVVGPAILYDNSSLHTLRAVSPSTPLPVQITDSSNALVKAGDSVNNAIRVNIIAGAGSGGTALADQAAFSTAVTSLTPIGGYFTTTASVVPEAKAGVLRMSSVRALWTFPVDSTGGVITDSTQRAIRITSVDSTSVAVSSVSGRVTTAPNDTSWASSAGFHFNSSGELNVTGVGGSGSTAITINGVTVSTSVQNSSGYLAVRLTDGSAFTNYSTTVNVSSLGGVVAVSSMSSLAGIVRVAGSSLVESSLNVSVRISDGSTWVTLGTDYSDGSTASTVVGPAILYDNSSNHTLRAVSLATPLPVQPIWGSVSYNSTTSTVVSTATSAVYSLISSAASTKFAVYAYSVTSTASGLITLEFMSSGVGNGGGSTGNMWSLDLGSQSSGITGANLAVSPPAWLFRTNANENLNVRLSSTNVQVRVSVSWFTTS